MTFRIDFGRSSRTHCQHCRHRRRVHTAWMLAAAWLLALAGCRGPQGSDPTLDTAIDELGTPADATASPPARTDSASDWSTVLESMALRLEPLDAVRIDAAPLRPNAAYRLLPSDVLTVVAEGVTPEYPVDGRYEIDDSGRIDLGPAYGPVDLLGLTIPQARDAIEIHLQFLLAAPRVEIEVESLAFDAVLSAEHTISQHGTVDLGPADSVYVAGMTLEQATDAVRAALSTMFLDPDVTVDMASYRGRACTVVVTDARGRTTLLRAAIHGDETIGTVLAQLGELPEVVEVNVERRVAGDGRQLLPVAWTSIDAALAVHPGSANFRVLPGDRVLITLRAPREPSEATLRPSHRLFRLSSPAG